MLKSTITILNVPSIYRSKAQSVLNGTLRRTALWLLVSIVLATSPDVFAAPSKPLTEAQLIAMSTGYLKNFPGQVIDIVKQRGVDFFPRESKLVALKNSGVHPSVLPVVREKFAESFRIKVCHLTGNAPAIEKQLTQRMVEYLRISKADLSPFGSIPVDDEIGPPQGFGGSIKPQKNTHYFLIIGKVIKKPGGYALNLAVLYRTPSGLKYSIKGAANPPQSLSAANLDTPAQAAIQWSIKTLQLYAQK